MTNPIIPINFDLLKETCLASIPTFGHFPGFETVETIDGVYYFKDNGADILAVAHLDHVQDCNHFHKIDIKGKDYVLNASLDDRLGAYTILYLLPSLGLKYDILLTEGEEMGRSTAAHFTTDKHYKWMFSFDRRLDDVVMYQFDCKFGRNKLKVADFKIGQGSFSDIAFLDHLKCMGFNIGVGYENEHSAWAIMDVEMYLSQVKKFVKFYNLFKGLHFRYTPKPSKWNYYKGSTYPARGVGNEWARYTDYWDAKDRETDTWFEQNHYWDVRNQKWIRKSPALPAPSVTDPIYVNGKKWEEVCEICGLPPQNPNTVVYQGAMMVCETCLPYAATCDICGGIVRDDRILDGACPDCQDAINAYLDDDDDTNPQRKDIRL